MGNTCTCHVNYCYGGKDPNELNLEQEDLVIYSQSGKHLDNLNFDIHGENPKTALQSAYTSTGT